VQRHRKRLGQRRQLQRHAGGHGLALHRVAQQPVAERAFDVRVAHRTAVEAHVQALVGQAFQAIDAAAARPAGVDGHAVAHLHARDVERHRGHRAGHFMAQDHRPLDAHRAKAALVEVVQVRAADAAEAYVHQHLARAHLAGVLFHHLQIVGGIDHQTPASPAQGFAFIHGCVSDARALALPRQRMRPAPPAEAAERTPHSARCRAAASAPALSASITVIDTRSDLSHDTQQLSLFGAPTLMGNSIVWPFTASWPSH
jgi:hypothetical protein